MSNLSDTMREVDTNEKKSPIIKRVMTKKRINLSTFFHHS